MTRTRVLAAAVGVAILGVVVLAVAGCGGEQREAYRVRAIFDNAGFAVEGEDVKVAGAIVGRVDALDVTPERKAAVTLRIDDQRFASFHADAHCEVRSEGLLAVKFVDCDPGTDKAPALSVIRRGPGSGDRLMPVTRTSSPVDFDLVTNIARGSRGQELSVILSELGAGFAGRGDELKAVIHRAAPGLGATNATLARLAHQNKALDRFVANADAVLTPLARRRREIARFIRSARMTAGATAHRSVELRRGITRLPAFLRELRTSMSDLGGLADGATPVLADLGDSGPDLGRATAELERVATVGPAAFAGLGKLAARAGPAAQRVEPLAGDLRDLGGHLRPAAADLEALLASFEKGRGIQHGLELLFNATSALNGFDAQGHFARATLLSSACSEYTTRGFFGCDSAWGPVSRAPKPTSSGAAARSVASLEPVLDYLLGP